MNLLLLWLTQTPPAEGYASPRYIILGVIVVLYIEAPGIPGGATMGLGGYAGR